MWVSKMTWGGGMQPSKMTWGRTWSSQDSSRRMQFRESLTQKTEGNENQHSKTNKSFGFRAKNVPLLLSRTLPFVSEIRIIQETYFWSKSYRDRTLNLRLGFQCVAQYTIVTRMIDCLVHFGDPLCVQLWSAVCVYNYDRLFGAPLGDPLLHPCYRAPRRSALPLNHWRPGEVARAVQQHTHHQCNEVVTVQQFIHKVHWSCNSATIHISLVP